MKYIPIAPFIYLLILTFNHIGNGTIDVNASHLQYIADHLRPGECRVLVASLHFQTFDLPNALDQAERKVPKDLTCFQQLVHWNSDPNGGRNNTHEILSRRLKQLNHKTLALWLTNATFESVHEDFERAITDRFLTFFNSTIVTDRSTPALRVTTPESQIKIVKQDVHDTAPLEVRMVDPTEWTVSDTIIWTIVVFLILIIIVLLIYLIMASPCWHKNKGYRKISPDST